MGEQSHKQEMSAAVRGDFARLRARGVATTIAPSPSPPEPERDEPVGTPTAGQTQRRSLLRLLRGR